MTLIWNQLVESAYLQNYQDLKAHAVRGRPDPDWAAWRDKQLTHLRDVIEKEKQQEKTSKNQWYWAGHTDNSRLVEIFLLESITTRRGRKPVREAVLRVFGFGLPPREKKNTAATPYLFTKR